METQKILKPSGKTVIVSDYREREVNENLKQMGAVVNSMNLTVGDFIASDRIAIERKDHQDFISSIIDGRIFQQSKDLKKNFEKAIIIVEGSSDLTIDENAYKAAIASLLTDFDISIVHTKNPMDTAKLIYWIAKKEQQENKYSVSFKVGKKSPDIKKLKEQIVASLPGVSNVISRRLLEYFGSIEKIFVADENDLRKIKGVGKVLARRIRNTLHEKY